MSAEGPGPAGPYPDLGGAYTPLFQRLRDLGVADRVVHMGKIGPRGRSADFVVDDPEGFVRDLEETGRCCVDTPLGRILHPGRASLREDRLAHSLHVAVEEDGAVLAHLDRYSPVARTGDRRVCRYSPGRVLVHNVTRLAGDLVRFVFGHRVDCAPLLLSLRTAGVELPPQQRRSGRGPRREPGPPAAAGRPLPDAIEAPAGLPDASAPAEPEARLPFTAIDEAVNILDTPAEPWSVHCEARVTGRLDADGLRSAVRRAVAGHPLARARARAAPGGRTHVWEVAASPDVDPVAVVDCPSDAAVAAAREALLSLRVPLAAAPPLRVLLARPVEKSGDVVVLNASHTATDLRGGLRLFRSVARAYAGQPDPVPGVDPASARQVVTPPGGDDAPTRLRRLRVLAATLADLITVPARVAPDGGMDAPGYGIHQVRLSAEETAPLVRLEKGPEKEGATDVLVAALHLAIALWNIEHGVRCGRVGVLVPVDLRPDALRDEVVGNVSVLTRVVTTPEQRSLSHVLPVVAAQTRRREQDDTFRVLVGVLARAVSWPAWARRRLPELLAVTGNRLVDTAALSYLGVVDPPRFGRDAGETVELWLSPPARMPLGLSVGAVVAGGRLHLAFRYRRPLLSADAARSFAQRYILLLGRLLDQSGSESGGARRDAGGETPCPGTEVPA